MPPEEEEELEKSTQLVQSKETVDFWREKSPCTVENDFSKGKVYR